MRFRIVSSLTGILLRLLGYGLIGSLVTAIAVYVAIVESGPDLSVWHYAELDEEFTTESDVTSFEQYLALEDRLFRQLDDLVYAEVPRGGRFHINRFSRGSLSDPDRWPTNWNRSFVLPVDSPEAGILMLHGLSDSPYSVRALGAQFHAAGASVLGLRIPGHGTAPSGLVDISWQDMAAAVHLAAGHLAESVGDKPLYIVGYSNGGALAIEYSLATLDNDSLPKPAGVILLSPEIAVSGAAAFAIWQARLGHLLGFDKLSWNSVQPESDPFKYGSFAVNAGDVAHRITTHLQQRITALQASGRLEDMPPILAFQSTVDATVTPQALVQNLFNRLPSTSNELVLYDINRKVDIEAFLKNDPTAAFRPLLYDNSARYDLTVVTNESDQDRRVVAIRNDDNSDGPPTSVYLAEWPPGVYSLSHVALPFPADDPLYGGPDAGESPGIQLGNLDLRGERGVLQISGTDLLRLRWNPFFPHLLSRSLSFMQLENPADPGAASAAE